MKKLLVVCGPTATGKTALGLHLAKKFNGEIISADSRQVYRGMDIGTGKDLSPDAKYKIVSNSLGYYEMDGVRIFGYDVADPKEDYSISQYLKVAKKALKEIYAKNKLPIVVGGTGFYIRGIVDGIPTIDVPRNDDLRHQLEEKSATELFESLSLIDSIKAGSLNASDKRNPRRLIRAIEVAQYLIDHKISDEELNEVEKKDVLFIGLTGPKAYLDGKIEKRVDSRLTEGIKNEIEELLSSGVNWEDQSMYSLGYRQYRDYFEGDVDEDHVISEWVKEERKYAGRQMVWFKKDGRIKWFDISEPDYSKKVENLVEKWHNNEANVQES
jgi:tRNA dimethylallyltransferase